MRLMHSCSTTSLDFLVTSYLLIFVIGEVMGLQPVLAFSQSFKKTLWRILDFWLSKVMMLVLRLEFSFGGSWWLLYLERQDGIFVLLVQ